MGDRRVVLGTSAVLVGLGSALISGAAVAAADTGETGPADTASSSAKADSPRATSPRRGVNRDADSARPVPAAAMAASRCTAPKTGLSAFAHPKPDSSTPNPSTLRFPSSRR